MKYLFSQFHSLGKGGQKGFTVLYAVLIASLLLSIGLGIYSVSLRDFILASSASESQKAIYAADSGVECVLYWNIYELFSPPAHAPAGTPWVGDAYCANTKINSNPDSGWTVVQTQNTATSTYTIHFGSTDEAPCAVINVGKWNTEAATTTIYTLFESRGYNTCRVENPRRVERGLKGAFH